MDNDDLQMDELTSLKQRADLLGISYHPSIGVEKLREKVNAAVMAKGPVAEDPSPAKTASVEESEHEYRQRMIDEAAKLIRVKVVCMNPAKKEWEGEIFSVGNSVVGTYKKYVPFNNDAGWHIPNIIYEYIKEKECQVFTSVRDDRGNVHRKGKLIKEFAIEVLPQLTPAELKDLAQRQAMANAID